MILIWTSDGGPLQIVGLILFLFQLLPHLLPSSITQQQQQQQQQQQPSASEEEAEEDPNNQIFWWSSSSSSLLWKNLLIVFFVFLTIIGTGWTLYYSFSSLMRDEQQQQQQNNASTESVDDGNGDNEGRQQQQQQQQPTIRTTNLERIQIQLQQYTGMERRLTVLEISAIIMMGICLTGVILFLLDPTIIALLFHWMIIGIVLYLHVGSISSSGIHSNNNDEEEKLEKLVETVQGMPIESFVSSNELNQLSISKLKQMIQIRSSSSSNSGDLLLHGVKEKSSLIEIVTQKRNYCDTCCICLEKYQRDDPLRILPKCCHEIHLECIDQWVYTFANQNKLQQVPSCPLCKVPLIK